MSCNYRSSLVVVFVVMVGLSFDALGQEASFQGLGDLPGGDFYSSGKEISADGNVVVGDSRIIVSNNSRTEAFRWSKETGMVGLGDLPGGQFRSDALAVSADGTVIGGSSHSFDGQGVNSNARSTFRWTQETGMVSLGTLGGIESEVEDMTPDGSILCGKGFQTSIGDLIFRWTESGGMEILGKLPGTTSPNTRAWGMSADGNVIVGRSFSQEASVAIRWTESTGIVPIGDLAGGADHSISTYTFSFTESGDQLSQWRAYCPGGGFAIGFPQNVLQKTVDTQSFRLEKCVYDPNKQGDIIQEVLDRVALPWIQNPDEFRRLQPNARDNDIGCGISNKLIWGLHNVCSKLKNSSFSEEQEWRLVSETRNDWYTKENFRAKKGIIVPYVKIDLPKRDNRKFWNQVEIIIGPSLYPNESKESVRRIFRKYLGHTIKIKQTISTLREL